MSWPRIGASVSEARSTWTSSRRSDGDFDAARAEFAREVSGIPEAVEEGVVSWEACLAFSERLRSEMERQAERGVTRVEPGSELDRLHGLLSEIIALPHIGD